MAYPALPRRPKVRHFHPPREIEILIPGGKKKV